VKENNKRKIIFAIGIVLVLVIVTTITATYAYFSAVATTTGDPISGGTATTELDLEVEQVAPIQEKRNLPLVPLQDNALQSAISGTSGLSSCIDSSENASCQIYKITLTNTGTISLTLKGTLELRAKTNNDLFSNLKWQLLDNSTTVKAGSTPNSMTNTTLDNSFTINTTTPKVYYVAVWLSETNSEQANTDYGDFVGTISFTNLDGTDGISVNFGS